MKRLTLKAGLFVISSLMTAVWLMWGVGNYSGYCFAQSEYLSDDAKIRSVIQGLLDNYPPITSYTDIQKGPDGIVTSLFRKRPSNPVPYSSVNDFMQANPSCCKLSIDGPEGDTPSAWQRFTGDISGFVFVEYNVKFIDENDTRRSEKVNEFFPVSNCGRIR